MGYADLKTAIGTGLATIGATALAYTLSGVHHHHRHHKHHHHHNIIGTAVVATATFLLIAMQVKDEANRNLALKGAAVSAGVAVVGGVVLYLEAHLLVTATLAAVLFAGAIYANKK